MSAYAPHPGILDVEVARGPRAEDGAPPDLVIEIPHGATDTIDFTRVADRIEDPLPADLIEFFYVNTDVGAPELASAVAAEVVRRAPERTVVALRCRIPRTFLDCNRRLDPPETEVPVTALGGRVTPGLMPWVISEGGRAELLRRRRAYDEAVLAVFERALPRAPLLLLHSYAPRSVDVEVDLDIVPKLRAAYAPDRIDDWPLRPPVDLIHRLPDGTSLAPPGFYERLVAAFEGVVEVADNATYPLHPSTMGHAYSVRWPGRVIGMEVRRDLLADPFVAFVPAHIGAAKVSRLAAPLARALESVLPEKAR